MTTPRDTTWNRRFRRFRDAGFSVEEATWAADHRLRLNNPQVRIVLRGRELFVRDHMAAFGSTRQQATDIAMRQNVGKNQRRGEVNDDIYNVFREVSP